jgi:hypothetical protein
MILEDLEAHGAESTDFILSKAPGHPGDHRPLRYGKRPEADP